MTMKKVTIRDVADYVGLSRQTVSRVLNDSPDITADTRAKVLKAIETLKYRPALAPDKGLLTRTFVIGVVIPFDNDYLYSDAHLLQVIRGINREITIHNNSMLLSTATSSKDRLAAYNRLLKTRLVDGVIVEGGLGDEGVQLLVDKGYPVVMTGYNEAGIPCVRPNDEDGAYNLTQHLGALGHRRIGVIGGPTEAHLPNNARLKGYERALHDIGLSFDPALYIESNYTAESGYHGAPKLMSLPNPPTAIFAFGDELASGAMRWLQENGFQVPKDVSVAGFNDTPSAALFSPPLTSVHIFSSDLGQRAARRLFDLMEDRDQAEQEIVLPTQLIVRSSTGIAPHRNHES